MVTTAPIPSSPRLSQSIRNTSQARVHNHSPKIDEIQPEDILGPSPGALHPHSGVVRGFAAHRAYPVAKAQERDPNHVI